MQLKFASLLGIFRFWFILCNNKFFFGSAGMRCFYFVGFVEEERNNDALVYVIYQICYMFITASMQDQIMQHFWRDILIGIKLNTSTLVRR